MRGTIVLRRSTAWVLPVLISACTHLTMPAVPGEPLVSSLPFQLSGIRDGRAQFADNFSQELARGDDDKTLSKWLHRAGGAPSGAPAAALDAPGLSVLVVPGILGDCVDDQALPFSDGVVRPRPRNYTEGYAKLGAELKVPVRAIEVRGRASSEDNAAIVARELATEAQRPDVRSIVLVAYSKGVPDALVALDKLSAQKDLPPKLRALVSVSGVVMGTPVADQAEFIYENLAARFSPLDCTPSTGGEVSSLTVRERAAWLATRPPPAGLNYYSIVAYTDRESIAPALVGFYDALSTLDRKNDGQVLASMMVLPSAKLLAEVKSDHWTYTLALNRSPSALVRNMASPADFPRDAFFRALVRTVASDLAPR